MIWQFDNGVLTAIVLSDIVAVYKYFVEVACLISTIQDVGRQVNEWEREKRRKEESAKLFLGHIVKNCMTVISG